MVFDRGKKGVPITSVYDWGGEKKGRGTRKVP